MQGNLEAAIAVGIGEGFEVETHIAPAERLARTFQVPPAPPVDLLQSLSIQKGRLGQRGRIGLAITTFAVAGR